MDLKHADRQTSYANRATPRPTGPPPMIANLTKTHGNHIFNFLSSKLLDVEINRKNHSRKPKKKKILVEYSDVKCNYFFKIQEGNLATQ